MREFIFSSESVTEGHPDKIADQISDSVLDAVLAEDPTGRVACETLITTGLVVVAGEISTTSYVDISRLARETIIDIGYDRAKYGFDAHTCGVMVALDEQSPDIAQGVDDSFERQQGDGDALDTTGAGDQGMMFGYACRETPELMPLPITLAHRITKQLSDGAQVRPDARTCGPTARARSRSATSRTPTAHCKPVEITRLLISTQHAEEYTNAALKADLIEHVLGAGAAGRAVRPTRSSAAATSCSSTRPASS